MNFIIFYFHITSSYEDLLLFFETFGSFHHLSLYYIIFKCQTFKREFIFIKQKNLTRLLNHGISKWVSTYKPLSTILHIK